LDYALRFLIRFKLRESEKRRRRRRKGKKKKRILIIEKQYSSYLLSISIKL